MSLSHKGVVKKLKALVVPEGWKESPLLRNCFPLVLNVEGRWTEDATVRRDDDLGLRLLHSTSFCALKSGALWDQDGEASKNNSSVHRLKSEK